MLELLACAIRQNEGIVGFRRWGGKDKISLYADDGLIYLGNPGDLLINTMSIIKKLGRYSGFSINWVKSVMLPKDPMKHLQEKGDQDEYSFGGAF